MRMRMPTPVWAALLRGREAESADVEQLIDNHQICCGVGLRERWQEYDGERSWQWREQGTQAPFAREWTQYYIMRMVWIRRDGFWYGKWAWDEYDREEVFGPRAPLPSASTLALAGPSIPQEVLLGVIHAIRVWLPPCCRASQ